MPIKITEAETKDYEGFLEVFKEIELLHRQNASWKFKKPEPLFSKEYFEKLINDKKNKFFLAKDENEILGYSIVLIEEIIDHSVLKSRKWLDIQDLAVKIKHQKKGIGSLIMQEIEKFAKNHNINEIELNVWLFNTNAIKFYENKGYGAYSQRMRKTID